jgi:hypothetical protein
LLHLYINFDKDKKVGYLKIRINNALTNKPFGHFQMTCKSSQKEVSSSRNLKIKVGFPFLNKAEKTVEPKSFRLNKTSKNNKS